MTKRILLLILFSPFLLFAKIEDWNTNNIYSTITEACDLIDPNVIQYSKIDLDKYRAGIYPSKSFSKLINDLSRESFSTYLNSTFTESDYSVDLITQNNGYKKAFQECLQKSPIVANYISHAIKKTNSQGKTLAFIATAFIFRGSYSVWSKLSSFGKKVFSSFSILPIGFWTHSFISKNIDQQKVSSELEKKCGPKNEASFSECAGNEVVAKFAQLEASINQKEEDSRETKNYIKNLVIQQIQTLNQELLKANSSEQKNILRTHLADREALLKELN